VNDKSQKLSRPAKLHLKLRSGLTKAELETVSGFAREAGASGVRPLFPGSTDEELACLYTVDVESESAVPKLIKSLEKHPAVEFVETEVKRKLKPR
jgi:hypothetical protein